MPAKNKELASIFTQIADAIELKGETGFKVLAYRRAARALVDSAEDVVNLDKESRLESITGIGSGIARKIHEYLATGRMKKHQEAISGLPEGLFAMLELQGLGPRTVRLLYEKLKVNNLEDLKRTIADGSAASLPGMGVRKVSTILKSIQLSEKSGKRMFLNEAAELAESVIHRLKNDPNISNITAAGSLRRGKETVGDIDILTTGKNPKEIVKNFTSHPSVRQILAAGTTKASVLFETRTGLRQVDLRIIDASSYGAALQYFTGSKGHNIALRSLAQKKGLKISEYGVFRGKKRVAGKTEKAVYTCVNLPYIEPELREDRGEIEAAAKGKLPRLVELKNIKSDLHMHTRQSDGKNSVEEMVAACQKLHYTHIAITEHSVSAGYAGGLTADELMRHCDRVDRFNAHSKGFKILKATEVDITTSGKLDYPDKILARLDLVVASIHQGFKKNVTERVCAALKNPLVHIIAHPTGRLIGKREGYDIDLDKVIETAARFRKILEINAYYGRLDLNDIWARKAKQANVKLSINTDAHAVKNLDWMKYGILVARRAWLTRNDVINCLSTSKLLKFLKTGI